MAGKQVSLNKIVAMLRDERVERRCAAAMVLGELKIRDVAAVTALRDCLADGPPPLQLYALEALSAARARKLTPHLTPLLDSPDDEVRRRASELLRNEGAHGSAALAEELSDAPVSRRRTLVGIVVRNHDDATLERLVARLADKDVGDDVANALVAELEKIEAGPRKRLQALLLSCMAAAGKKNDRPTLQRVLRVVGAFDVVALAGRIAAYCEAEHDLELRQAALRALRRPLCSSSRPPAAGLLGTLLRCASAAEETIARPAVELLRECRLGAEQRGQIAQLLQAPHPHARRLAVEQLGATGDRGACKALLRLLRDEDPVARDTAARLLAAQDGVVKLLIGELKTALDDPAVAGTLCRLLRRHGDELKPADKKKIAQLAEEQIKISDSEQLPEVVRLLRSADAEAYRALVLGRASRLRRSKRFEEAFSLLRCLERDGLLDDESRYFTLVAGLCSTASKKNLARSSRSTDPILRHAVELLATGYPVARKLTRDKGLDSEDLFFIGFNFVESKDDEEREFGGDLLRYLAERSPRSKLGRSAKNKLRLIATHSP